MVTMKSDLKILRQLFTTALLVLFWIPATPAQQPAFLTEGLVAYYPFNGNANDGSEKQAGGPLFTQRTEYGTDRFGNTGASIKFNGTNSIARSRVSNALTNSSSTISLWAFISNRNTPGTLFNRWRVGTNSFWDDASIFTKYPSSNRVFIVVNWPGAAENNPSALNFTNPFPNGEWFHMCMALNPTNAAIYVNGVMSVVFTNANPKIDRLFSRPAAFGIGAQDDGGGPIVGLDGQVDDLRLFNKTLSSSEVWNIFQYERTPHRASAVADLTEGVISGIRIVDPGYGYGTNPPVVIITPGNTGQAVGVAQVSNGVVTSIDVTSPGMGYNSAPAVRIASPPFKPNLNVEISRVKVSINVVLGRKYQMESTKDMVTWTPTGPTFIAEDEQLEQEFEVDAVGRYFRINQVP